MALRINQTFGQIGIHTRRAWMDIKQPPPRAIISQKPPQLTIDRQLPKVHIDQTRPFAESGLKPPLELAHDFFREGLEAGLEAVGRIAEEGDRLMGIENGDNPIADMALERAYKEYEFNVTLMPQSRPDIQWDMGYLHLNWKPNPAQIDWEVHTTANIDASRHKVEIYMKQWPDIKIEYLGNRVDQRI